ncbi:MAG: hypothetical protein FWH27_16080 [Planctomycetaceae bacterium]|nr:hypothetical protein [Planctomycetaceae bacterium]
MQTLNIAIPDALNDYVLQQVAEQGDTSAGEYVRSLIPTAQKEGTMRKLEAELLLGLHSGPGGPVPAGRSRRRIGRQCVRTSKSGTHRNREAGNESSCHHHAKGTAGPF